MFVGCEFMPPAELPGRPAGPDAVRLETPADSQRDAEILRLRAEEYSRPRVDHDSHTASETDVLVVRLGVDCYAIPCTDIEEIVPLQNLVSLPNTPRGIIGISSNRGVLFAVLDPKQQLQIPGTNITTMHRVVVLRHSSYQVGILVDSIRGMSGINTEKLDRLPAYLGAEKRRFVTGLTPDRTFLLNVKNLLEAHPDQPAS